MNLYSFDSPLRQQNQGIFARIDTSVKAVIGRTGIIESNGSPSLQSEPLRSTLMAVDGAA